MNIRHEAVLMLFLLLAAMGTALAADCGDLAGRGSSRELPQREERVRIFSCAGVEGFVADLDELDRDLLFLRAGILPVKELAERTTETAPPRTYGALIPPAQLARLKELVDAYYGSSGPRRGISAGREGSL